jgi:hypothetical protein
LPEVYDRNNAAHRGTLRRQTWSRISAARVAIAAELGLQGVHPLTVITPASEPRAYRDLGDRIREEGSDAPRVCARVLESLIAHAREKRTVEWLAEKAFTEGAWRTAKERVPKWADAQRAPADPSKPKTHSYVARSGAGQVRITEDAQGNVVSVEPIQQQAEASP